MTRKTRPPAATPEEIEGLRGRIARRPPPLPGKPIDFVGRILQPGKHKRAGEPDYLADLPTRRSSAKAPAERDPYLEFLERSTDPRLYERIQDAFKKRLLTRIGCTVVILLIGAIIGLLIKFWHAIFG